MNLLLILPLLTSSNVVFANDPSIADLAKCVSAFSNQTSLNSSGYTTLLTPSTDAKTQLLVLNNEGAKLVFPSKENLDYTFRVPGQSEIVRQQWTTENDQILPSWESQENGSAKISSNKNINLVTATDLAAKGLSILIPQKSATLQKDLKQLDQWVRLRSTMDGEIDVLSSGSKKVINEERLYSKLLLVNKAMEDLNSCKNIPNEKIQELTKMEMARLTSFKNKIGELKRESRKFTQCVKKITTTTNDKSSSTTSSSPGVR